MSRDDSSWSLARVAALTGAGAGLGAFATSAVLLLTKQQPSTALVPVVMSSVTAFLAIFVSLYFTRRHMLASREAALRWAELLKVIQGIESAAAKVTDTKGDSATVTQLMTDLEARGLWDDSDAQEFRKTLRLRNEFVHGDHAPTESDAVVANAVETARRLLDKVEKDQVPPTTG